MEIIINARLIKITKYIKTNDLFAAYFQMKNEIISACLCYHR